MNEIIAEQLKTHWQQLRGMTYDLLDLLTEENLNRLLPFPASQDIQYQLYCMLGTQESWLTVLRTGTMAEWDCSLEPAPVGQTLSLARLRSQFETADQALFRELDQLTLTDLVMGGNSPLHYYMVLVEHEAHHQGQLINFIYALDLPIPESWADKWALSR